jgi:MYXO-CTERM domain-containing protein
MCRRLPAVALLLALAAPAPAGVISGYDPNSQASHDTYDRFLRSDPGFPTAPVPNSSSAFLAAGVDLSGVGWVPGRPELFALTLISPQHFVTAAHTSLGPNTEVRFVNADGQVKSYTVGSVQAIPTPGQSANSDLLLATLTAAVPAADRVRHFGVAGVTAAQAVDLPILAYGRNDPAYQTRSPHLGTNEIDQVVLTSFGGAERTRVMIYDWTTGVPGEIYLIGGDSGGPAFVRSHGDLALIGVHYGVSRATTDPQPGDYSASTFVPEYVDGLNAAMAGSGFQVAVVPVPEPTGLLAVVGLALAAGVIRRRRAAGLSA